MLTHRNESAFLKIKWTVEQAKKLNERSKKKIWWNLRTHPHICIFNAIMIMCVCVCERERVRVREAHQRKGKPQPHMSLNESYTTAFQAFGLGSADQYFMRVRVFSPNLQNIMCSCGLFCWLRIWIGIGIGILVVCESCGHKLDINTWIPWQLCIDVRSTNQLF